MASLGGPSSWDYTASATNGNDRVKAIGDAALKYGVPAQLLINLVRVEDNSLNSYATSSKGAIGLTQLMPATAAQLKVNAYDPDQNLTGGAIYLRTLYQENGNDWRKALAAYNAGSATSPAGLQYADQVLAGLGPDKLAATPFVPGTTTGNATPTTGTTGGAVSDPGTVPTGDGSNVLTGALTPSGFAKISRYAGFAVLALGAIVLGLWVFSKEAAPVVTKQVAS